MGHGMPTLLILFLVILVGIIMVMACFNYTNLMIAKSLSRAREIGVRKIVGAKRFQVFSQFIGESIVFALIALAASYALLKVLKPAFLQLSIAREFASSLSENYLLYLYFVVFAVIAGLLAGVLPASYLSAFKPVRVLKDNGTLKVYSRITFRKMLIVAQFTFSIIFIMVTLVIYNQINYMIAKDYGINDKNIVNIRLQGADFQKFANEIRTINGIERVGGVSHPLGTWADRASDYKASPADEPFVMRDFLLDDNYIENLDVTFLAGENFDPLLEADREKHVILNEKALPYFRFTSPVAAIGQPIYLQDSLALTVIGVVKDFHFRPLSDEIGPVALRYNLNELGYLSAKFNPQEYDAIIASLEASWKKIDPVHPLEMKLMEEEIDDAYAEAGLKDILKIVGYVCFLAISLACLGMLGMSMYATRTRIKEIGIRKVMGATSREVAFHLSRAFLILIAFALLIGAPLGFLLGDVFLQQYAYKAPTSFLLLLTGIASIIVLGVLSIASQTWRASLTDPAKSLKYE
jgi:putative ABC transport system permease protein